jgi:alcohol dehydrogenase (NADP+)
MIHIEPNMVPKRKLASGEKIPCIGMGTFGSDRFTAEQVSSAVLQSSREGFRLFDCASVYGNEHLIGEMFTKMMKEGIHRKELFIISKVWNDMHRKGDVLLSLANTLKDLQLDYLDLYITHWPFRNYHRTGCDVNSRDPNSHPYIHEEFMETWRQMERLVDTGLVRYIGTSNMTIAKMKLLLRDCRIRPIANEMELHPCFQQTEFYQYCIQNDIQPIGFSPIGSPTRPERDMTAEDVSDIQHPTIVQIAKRHNIHPAVVCLKWAVQRGQIPIPFSIHENENANNLRSTIEDPLTEEEMELIKSTDLNSRLIKGQVFLWDNVDDWHILWDEDGQIRQK